MNTKRILALTLLVPFSFLSVYAVSQVGYWGIIEHHLPNPGGWQVFADLVIALVLVCSWMITDARKQGRNVWPYLLVTLFLGSFGPLLYILLDASEKELVASGA